MSFLARVTKGKLQSGALIGLLGGPGVGKTSFLTQVEDLLIIDAEGSSNHYEFGARFTPASWHELYEVTREVMLDPSSAKAIAVDSLDAAQLLVFDAVAAEQGVSNITEIGYGRGFELALGKFRDWLGLVGGIIKSGRLVFYTVHEANQRIDTPDGHSYDRTGMKLHPKIGALMFERSDLVAHVGIRQTILKNKKDGPGRQVVQIGEGGEPERYFRCVPTGGVLCKSRFSHPSGEIVPFTWDRLREFCV